ncbi:hypothetical protein O6H91_15G085600 [Diphasiastrum complanatum]|nr:hypothetical protein O6H91_15G085600 [Diphasiastrum complanatum]
MHVNNKDISADTNKDESSELAVGRTFNSTSTAFIENLPINKALSMQLEVQRQLQEQLEVQRQLQARIEAQSKYLQSILEKARETFAGHRATTEGLEAAQAELTNLATKVSLEGYGSALPELELALPDSPRLVVVQQEIHAADADLKSRSRMLTAGGHPKRSNGDQDHGQAKKKSKTFFCDNGGRIWTNEDGGVAKLQECTNKQSNQATINDPGDRKEEELVQSNFGRQFVHVSEGTIIGEGQSASDNEKHPLASITDHDAIVIELNGSDQGTALRSPGRQEFSGRASPEIHLQSAADVL